MIRAGMGLILGVVFVTLIQINQMRDSNAIAGTIQGERVVFNFQNTGGPLIGSEYFSDSSGRGTIIRSIQFEPYSNEHDPIYSSLQKTDGSFEYPPEKTKQLKLMQFFSLLKINK